MKIALCVVLLALSFAPPALAGQVYGSIFQNGRPLDGAPVLLRCGGETASNVTDVDGVYRLFARATGSCQIIVEPNGRNATATIYSYDRPTGYNFDLVDRSGRWELVQR
jgi:hypothetical protein